MFNKIYISKPYNIKVLKLTLFLISLGITMIFVESLQAMGANNTQDKKRLYIYSTRELSSFFKEIGYQDFWYNDMPISRNSDGTALRFLNKEKKKILIAKCDGSIKIIDSLGYQAWLNDAEQPVLWLSLVGNKVIVNYSNGMSEDLSFSPQSGGPDPSGKYLMKKDVPEGFCYTTIYAIEKPNIPIIKVDLCGVTELFIKDEKTYLVGKRFLPDRSSIDEVIIFEKKGQLWKQIDSIVIPRPDKTEAKYYMYYPVDLCPWKDEILFKHVHDFPVRSVWYSFDMQTRQLKKIGKMSIWGDVAFYLQCDILKKVVAEQKKKKDK